MIVVTGANGTLGRLVVEHLLAELPPERVAVSVRDPAGARELADRGVRVRRGDFADPASLAAAFEGAGTVLVVSSNDLPAALAHHRNAFDAAEAAGAGRILYTSHQGARHDSPFAAAASHAATEDLLAGSGVPWTSLRNGFYASTVPMLIGDATRTGELPLPADAPVAWTTREDLAAATARLLVDGAPDGPTAPLTGPATLDAEEFAGIVAGIAGRPVRRVVVGDDEYRESLVAQGVPAGPAELLVGMFAAGRRGDFAPADPTLATLIGRPATSLATHLEAALAPADRG